MSDTPPSETALTLFLAEQDVPCPNPKCGFNLRGLKDATCPECKESLSLMVRPRTRGSSAPVLIAIAMASIAIALAAEMNAKVALSPIQGSGQLEWWQELTWLWRGAVSVPLGLGVGATVAFAPFIRRKNRNTGRATALVASILAVTVIVVATYVLWQRMLFLNDFGIAFW